MIYFTVFLNEISLFYSVFFMFNNFLQWFPKFVRFALEINFNFMPDSWLRRWRSYIFLLFGSWALYTVFLLIALKNICFGLFLRELGKRRSLIDKLCGLTSITWKGFSNLYRAGCRLISVFNLSFEAFSVWSSLVVFTLFYLFLSGINFILNLLARLMYSDEKPCLRN